MLRPPPPRRPGLGPRHLGALALMLAVAVTSVRRPPRAANPDAAGPVPPVAVTSAALATILAHVRAAGASAVLVNVWATWCEPCREELPDLLRFYRENRARGLRLVLISADDEDRRQEVASVLADAAARAGLGAALDARAFIKHDDDMKFIDGLDPRWGGALPATFLYDGRGQRARSWLGPVTYHDLETGVGDRLTNATPRDKKTEPKPKPKPKPGRQP